MRDLKRNQKKGGIFYSMYLRKEPMLDEQGFKTGETANIYGSIFPYEISVSASKGVSETNPFGKDMNYDKVMTSHNMDCPINEYSKLWIDIVPVIVNGTTETPNDYLVEKVSSSLNSISFAIKKVN